MSKTVSIRALFILAGLSLLTGCVRSPLKKNIKLKRVSSEKATYEKTTDDITVQAQVLSKKEAKKLLGTLIPDTEVIQISVTNNTPVDYELKKKYINLDILPNRILVKKLVDKKYGVSKGIQIAAVSGFSVVYGLFSLACILPCLITYHPIFMLPITALGTGITALWSKHIATMHNTCAKKTAPLLNALSPLTLSIDSSRTESMLLFVGNRYRTNMFNLGLCPTRTQNITHNFTIIL